jgi:hypothetical protein
MGISVRDTHSKLIPSKLYVWVKFKRVLVNAVRFSGVATAEEKNMEPVHPPREMDAVTFFQKYEYSLFFAEEKRKCTLDLASETNSWITLSSSLSCI